MCDVRLTHANYVSAFWRHSHFTTHSHKTPRKVHNFLSTNRSEHCLPPPPITKLLWCKTNTGWPIVLQICKSNDNTFMELVYNFEALNLYIFCFLSTLWRLVLFTVVYSSVIYSCLYVITFFRLIVKRVLEKGEHGPCLGTK
jgi:hypothetical protein